MFNGDVIRRESDAVKIKYLQQDVTALQSENSDMKRELEKWRNDLHYTESDDVVVKVDLFAMNAVSIERVIIDRENYPVTVIGYKDSTGVIREWHLRITMGYHLRLCTELEYLKRRTGSTK